MPRTLSDEPSLCLCKALNSALVDDAQHLTPHRSLYSMVSVEAPIDGLQKLCEHIGIEADCTIHIMEVMMPTSTMALLVAIIQRVNQKSVSAPIAGATPKKLLRRSLNSFLSVFKGSSTGSLSWVSSLPPCRLSRIACFCASMASFCLL